MKNKIFFMAILFIFTCFSIIHASEESVSTDQSTDSKITDKISPIIINYAIPGMPMKAEADRVEGFVIVKFTVTKDGDVANPVVVESVPPGYFENAALNALEKYKFKPASEYGLPVDYTLEWPFFFKFSKDSFSEDLESNMQACRYVSIGRNFIVKGEYEKSIEEISKAIELEPKFDTARFYRSLAYMYMEEYEKALPDIIRAIELTDKVYGYYNHRGSIYLFSEDYQKAIEDFSQSLTIEQRNIVAYINRGDAYRLSGKYEEAITDYTSALGMNEKLVHVHNNRGYVYYTKLKNSFQACKDFKTACELGDCRAYDKLKNQGVCD